MKKYLDMEDLMRLTFGLTLLAFAIIIMVIIPGVPWIAVGSIMLSYSIYLIGTPIIKFLKRLRKK